MLSCGLRSCALVWQKRPTPAWSTNQPHTGAALVFAARVQSTFLILVGSRSPYTYTTKGRHTSAPHWCGDIFQLLVHSSLTGVVHQCAPFLDHMSGHLGACHLSAGHLRANGLMWSAAMCPCLEKKAHTGVGYQSAPHRRGLGFCLLGPVGGARCAFCVAWPAGQGPDSPYKPRAPGRRLRSAPRQAAPLLAMKAPRDKGIS